MKKKIKSWLILFRAHTALLEVTLAVLGASLALGELYSMEILLWILFGALYHFVGYGMNSYVDWKKGFDKEDPRKQHHPLNTGDITPKQAKVVVFTMFPALALYGEYLGQFSFISHVCLGIMILSGLAYNYLGKYTSHKYVPISIAHTMVFVYPYALYSSDFNIVFWAMTMAVFVHHVFQIAISGDIKDVDMDESSLIQSMGVELVDSKNIEYRYNTTMVNMDYLVVPTVVQVLALALTLAEVALLFIAHSYFNLNLIHLLSLASMSILLLMASSFLVINGIFDRHMRVKTMSMRELFGIWGMAAAITPVIGIEAFAIIVLSGSLYLASTSKIMWGNTVTPDV